jgi:hypothetical protein
LGDRPALAHGDVFRVRAYLDAEHLVADPEFGHGRPDLVDTACELRAGARASRPANAGKETDQPVLDVTHAHGVAACDRRRMDPDEHLVLLREGPLDFGDPQNFWRSVPILDDCSHQDTPSRRVR